MILGMSESGKSVLAKCLVRRLRKANRKVVIYDPLLQRDWGTEPYDDSETVNAIMLEERKLHVFIDECGEVFRDYDSQREYAWWATRSRHYGHSVYFIAQRAVQIPRTMRDQCSRLYLFTSSATDGKIHADEWNSSLLESCNRIPQLCCYKVSRFSPPQKLRVIPATKDVAYGWK
jgi:hypothetical protein